MTIKKVELNQDKLNKIVSDARKTQAEFEQSYRGQALKMYPWICGRCAREFTHTNLAELTVHHRNHNHDDNPADGSNWELLCLYCHDNEHQRYEEAQHTSVKKSASNIPLGSHNPFANLKSMLDNKK
jgi:hypothetical protein